jgi:hypothetical protein
MTTADALDRVIETITVDCYNEDEEYTAFLTVIEDEVALPAPASLLGTPVTVVQLDYADPARGLVVVCRGPDGTGEVAFGDVAFPADTLAAWLHAAYRHHLGLRPFPAIPRPDWTWPPDCSPQMDRGGAAPVRLLVDGAFIVRQAAPSWTGRPW